MSAIYGVLGSCYQLRYPESHAQTDLDEAMTAFQEAIKHPDNVELEISNHIFLALLFNQRYHSIGNASDQSASLENLRLAVEIYSQHVSSLKPGKVFSSGINTLIGQYNRTGHIQELEQSIQLFQQLVQLLDGYPEALPDLLVTLASAFQILHSHSFHPGTIEEAIEYMERAISIGETSGQATAQAYHRYGVCLRARYQHNGNQRDLQAAAEALHRAVSLAVPGDPDLPAYLTDEGTVVSDRYNKSSDINDLEAAISSYQKAVDMLALSASDSVLCWNNLATGLLERYKQLGSLADLEQAILLMQRVLASDEADPKDQAGANSNLGVALADRFESAGNMADLEHGLQAHRRAVAICNPASPDYAMYLNNLGSILRVRHRLNRELKDLEEAILIQYKSVELTSPGSPTYLTHLNNLANALLERHQIYNEESDLEESIRIYRKVVELSSGSNHLLAISNTNLGNALFRRYQLNQDPIALEEVEKSYRLAQSLTDEGSLIMDRLLGNIGNVLHEYYQISGDQKYLSEYRQVMTDASCKGMLTDPVNILPMIKQWARYETARQAWEVAGKAYAYSLQTINQLFRTQLLRKHKETWLSEAQGIPARAAFARAKMGDCNEAVLILENERTHLQSEALLQHGADLETLRATRPDLVDRYSSISARLSSYQSTELDKVNTTLDLLAMQSANRELEALIEEIRHIDGYTNFLQRFTLAQIHETAGPAPLVYLVVTPEGGMAFIVDSIRVTLLPLDQMTESALRGKLADFVQEQINWLSALTNKNTDQHQKAEATSAWFSQLDEITGWLWNAGIGLLCEHLNAAGITRGVLIPTGLLGLLPLHSAWCEDPDAPTGRHYALDSIAFSYAPNAQSLQRAQGTARRVAPTALLAVDNPDGSLRSSENEVQVAAAGFEQARVLAGVEATRQAVIEALPGYPVLHFSTHGHANWEDPLRGGLLLAGGEFTLADLLGLHLQNARMAVLSACQTGVQDVTLPDEAISLAGGCLQAGIAGVVASLWTVDDVSTAMLMARFYDLWKKDGLQPAEALLGAQIWLRDTTNGEKKRYFKTALPEFTNQRLPSSAADAFFKSVVLKDDNQRAFVHPYYWAAFTLTGV
ncbi:MAG: CHAT domain-containing protein [Chloroflexota bacterium]|nr:MAG: CHAT domain-containing protein [Chloroflexota bacterium]